MSETLFLIEDDVHPVMDVKVLPVEKEVKAEIPAGPIVTEAPPTFAFIGENKRRYLFVTDDAQSDFMSAAGLDAFLKTLGARKMALDDVAVFNMARHQGTVAFTDLAMFFKPQAVVLLGASATQVGIPEIAANSLGKVGDIPVFQTYSFDVLLGDNEKKAAFWPILKSLLV